MAFGGAIIGLAVVWINAKFGRADERFNGVDEKFRSVNQRLDGIICVSTICGICGGPNCTALRKCLALG